MDHHAHHAGLDHSGMDHGHGDGPMCKMNMLFNWDTTDLCIVFKGWHVRGAWGMFGTLIAVIAIAAFYEAVREFTCRYENATTQRVRDTPTSNDGEDGVDESSSLVRAGRSKKDVNRTTQIALAVLYGFQVFYSFFVMLIFMTYNGYVMIAVGVGAAVGRLMFAGSKTSAVRDVTCH